MLIIWQEDFLEVGIHTKIIDQDPARCEHLSELLPKASIICGDGTDERLLIQEGLENVDAFCCADRAG